MRIRFHVFIHRGIHDGFIREKNQPVVMNDQKIK